MRLLIAVALHVTWLVPSEAREREAHPVPINGQPRKGTGLVADDRPCGPDWLLHLSDEENAERWKQRVPRRILDALTFHRRPFLSQDYQDPLIQRVFRCVQTTNRFFVEFGFNEPGYAVGSQIPGAPNGVFGSSGAQTHMLYELGWRGLLLDGGQQNASINLHRHFLFQSNIAGIFTQHAVPKQLDFLSVDMDSHDLFVLRAIFLGGWRPRLFSAEFNRNYGSQRHPLTLLDPTLETGGVPRDYVFTSSNCSWGTSAAALALVAQEFGYTLIARVVGLDLFFLRDDLIAGKPVRNWTQIFDGLTTPTKARRGKFASSDPAILERLVDYAVYRKTGSVKAAVAAGGALLKKHFRHAVCWQSLFHHQSSTEHH